MKQKIINLIKLIGIVAFFILALGYCGNMDTECQSQREMMSEKPGRIIQR